MSNKVCNRKDCSKCEENCIWKPHTNLDWVRSLSAEDLGILIADNICIGRGAVSCLDYTDVISGNKRCDICWRDWLLQERKENKTDE